MSNFIYVHSKQALLDGDIDVLVDTLKVAIVDNSYIPNSDLHQFISDISINSIKYRTQKLVDVSSDNGILDADDLIISNYPGDAFNALIIYKDTGVDSTSRLIAYIDESPGLPFGGVASSVTINIAWSNGPTKIISLSEQYPNATNTILNGSISPSSGTGNDGDFYIETNNYLIYGPKFSGTWQPGISIIGPTGPTGSAGPTGPVGVLIQSSTPSSTDIIWADTSESGDMIIPSGGLAGEVLTKVSNTSYDISWSPVTSSGLSSALKMTFSMNNLNPNGYNKIIPWTTGPADPSNGIYGYYIDFWSSNAQDLWTITDTDEIFNNQFNINDGLTFAKSGYYLAQIEFYPSFNSVDFWAGVYQWSPNSNWPANEYNKASYVYLPTNYWMNSTELTGYVDSSNYIYFTPEVYVSNFKNDLEAALWMVRGVVYFWPD